LKKPHIYLISVFLTILLIFSFLVTGLLVLLRCKGMEPDTSLQIAQDKHLAQTVHDNLERYFRDQENTTGIPLSVYENAISVENCDRMIRDSLQNGFSYLNGRTAKIGNEPDFSALEQDMRAFFEDYADRHKIEKDAGYELAVKNSLNAAKQQIISRCDVLRFRTLDDAGVMKKAQRILKWAGFLAVGAGLISLLLILFLFMTNHAHGRYGFYWTGCALLIASVLLLIPSWWLSHTRWFDRFAVKADQIYTAVTGYLYSMTGAAMIASLCGIAAAVLLLAVFVLLHLRSRKKKLLREVRH